MDQDIQIHKIPSEADFLIAYSVVPGKINHLQSARFFSSPKPLAQGELL